MRQILTSDQFLAGVIAILALQNRKEFSLTQTDLDRRFEKAFEKLLESESRLKIKTNFTFYADPLHGDSVTLRDTLLAARERGLIQMNNPSHQTFVIKMDDDKAKRYLKRIPIPQDFLRQLVDSYFDGVGS